MSISQLFSSLIGVKRVTPTQWNNIANNNYLTEIDNTDGNLSVSQVGTVATINLNPSYSLVQQVQVLSMVQFPLNSSSGQVVARLQKIFNVVTVRILTTDIPLYVSSANQTFLKAEITNSAFFPPADVFVNSGIQCYLSGPSYPSGSACELLITLTATGFLTFSFINITTGAPFPITGSGTPNQTLIRPYNPTLGIADGEKDIILQWSLY